MAGSWKSTLGGRTWRSTPAAATWFGFTSSVGSRKLSGTRVPGVCRYVDLVIGSTSSLAAVQVLRHVFSSLPFADACKCTRTLRLDGDMQVVVVDRESGRAANGNPSKSAARILGEVREPTHQTQISVGRAVTDDGAFSVVTAVLSPRAYCVIFGEESE